VTLPHAKRRRLLIASRQRPSHSYAARMRSRLGLGLIILAAVGVAGCNLYPGGRTRPTAAITESYVLEYARGTDARIRLTIDKDAAACLVLRAIEIGSRSPSPVGTASPLPTEPEPTLYVACVLATNIDGTFIAGEAFGKLNDEDTPALEAIIWRARLDADRTFCESAGLLGERLEHCHAAVDADVYRVTDGDLTVVVPKPTGD